MSGRIFSIPEKGIWTQLIFADTPGLLKSRGGEKEESIL